MLSMGVLPNTKVFANPSTLRPSKAFPVPFSDRPKLSWSRSRPFSELKFGQNSRKNFALYASSASETFAADDTVEKEKLGVVVRPMEKPRLVLKFVWMEKNIGLALDRAIPGHGTIPLSPYYFWPRKDAWDELKLLLESKPWISQKQMIILLNQATDVINLWQQAGGNLQ